MRGTAQAGKRTFFTSRRKRILLASFGVVVFLVGMTVTVTYKTFRYFYDKAPGPFVVYTIDKTVDAKVPSSVPVEVTIEENIPAELSKLLHVELPIRKDIEVLIDDDFSVPIDKVLSVPVDQEIYVEADVPVALELPLEGKSVETTIFGIKKVLPLSGTLPIHTVIHLKQPVRVKADASIPVKDTVDVRIRKKLTLPLDVKLDVTIPVEGIFDVRFAKRIMVNARLPESIPVDVHMEIAVPKAGGRAEESGPVETSGAEGQERR